MSIEELAFVLVVRATAELDVVHRGFASHSVRFNVMELDERRCVASPPALADERAGTTVAEPHCALDLGRDIPAARRRAATGPQRSGASGLTTGRRAGAGKAACDPPAK